ncbi:MAG: hypothetical protein QF742_00725 [Alphaproteobacteria bacterium]|nr:hypothetical protein [Alphaproteobacteria bacterium]
MDNAMLTAKVKEIARDYGACAVGITTRETLAGGPPSTDLEYVLPGACAVGITMRQTLAGGGALDRSRIRAAQRTLCGGLRPAPRPGQD